MAESLSTLKERWLEQHRKVCAIDKYVDHMNESELRESLEMNHRRIEYLDRLKEDIDFELGFAIEGICRMEMLLAGHNGFAATKGRCHCEWCKTGSDQHTGFKG